MQFGSLVDFQQEFKDINQEEQIARLHKMLHPHLLRRIKKDVLKDLPPKKELILRVDLSSKQKEYYKAILTRNYEILTRRGGAQISLINVVMELRKLCCHAYMLEGVEQEIQDTDEAYRQLLDSSGKLHLLDKMMVKLKEQGHRVLIYTQFQHMLDLLEDYCSYKKWLYERIDGKVGGAERQIRIDRFNAKNSSRFCFLLSTRAGGVGINLATADTVIIYDSDWNPHADLQAMARAHRLGQTNKVMIFRLITRGTIEERMIEMTKQKMVLEHLVVGQLKAQNINQEELDDIIRYGSKELFADETDEAGRSRQIHYDDAAIDRLLDREQVGKEEAAVDVEEEDGFLKAFKVANFEYIDEAEAAAQAEEEARKAAMENRTSTSNMESKTYWEELLRDRYEVHKVEEFTSLGKGKRNRKQMVSVEEDDLAGLEDVSSDGEEDSNEAEWIDAEMISSGTAPGKRPHVSKKKARVDETEPHPLMEGEGKSFRVLGFNQNQRAVFVQILMRYGLGEYDWVEFTPRLKQKTAKEIHEYGVLFLSHIAEDITDTPTFSDGVPKEGLKIEDVLVRIALMSSIRDKVKSGRIGTLLFSVDILSRYPGLSGGKSWKEEHDLALLQAILKHGYGRWQAIVDDKSLPIQGIIYEELNLFVNGSFYGGSQINDGANTAPLEVLKVIVGVNSIGSDVAQTAVENANQAQLTQDLTSVYHFREVQRRMVEYIKRRVLLLEKGLNAECQKEFFGDSKPCETADGGSEFENKVLNMESPTSSEDDSKINSKLPIIASIAPEEVSASACDDDKDRLDLGRLYNEMCVVVKNIQESVQADSGILPTLSKPNKTLRPLETVCKDINQILAPLDQSPMTSSQVEVNPDRAVQSDTEVGISGRALPESNGDNTKTSEDMDCSPEVSKNKADSLSPVNGDKGDCEKSCLPKGSEDVEKDAAGVIVLDD